MKMLASHVRFLANIDLKYAKRLHKEIISSAKSLKKLPERNSWLTDNVIAANKYRKMVISDSYLLIYQIKNETVYIDHIVDCRQDYMWLLK